MPLIPKYKVGDVVLTVPDRVEMFPQSFCNQLCIVRQVDNYDADDCEPRYAIVYDCTTIATGEAVQLYGHEIVEEPSNEGR